MHDTAMSGDAYERLAAALDGLANGFPRTESNVELQILRRVFSEAEIEVMAALTGRYATATDVARRAALETEHVRAVLDRLDERHLIWTRKIGGGSAYRLAPFLPVGIYEAHLLETHDVEFARLVEEYFRGGGAAGIMGGQPAIHRVVPARGAVDMEWVLPYDDVRGILESAASLRIETCACRLQQESLGTRRCDFPLELCLWFSFTESNDDTGVLSLEDALTALDEAEEMGLVHTVGNVASGVGYVCNCCGCCCSLLRGITEWGIAGSVAQANYLAEIDALRCTGCGECGKRCQVDAIAVRDDGSRVVRRESCIGCGLCVTGCPSEAAHLQRKPEDEIVPPPATFGAWEHLRSKARGLDAAPD